MSKIQNPSFSTMAEKWPSKWVARSEARNFTGGIIEPSYLANLDCQGKGPAGRIRCGRKVAYPVEQFVEWLEQRTEAL